MHKAKANKILAGVTLTFLLFLPTFAFAAPSTPPDANTTAKTGITYECSQTVNGVTTYGNCNIDDVIAAVNKLVDFARNVGLGFSVIVIAYAGIIYLMSDGKPAELTRANKMFVKVGYGIFFILAAWLIVHLITNSLLSGPVQHLVPVTN